MAVQSSGKEKWLTRRNISLFNIIPVISLIFIFTNEWHGLIWPSQELITINNVVWLNHPHGAVYYIYVNYIRLITISVALILFRTLFKRHSFYRKQVILFLIVLLLPNTFSIIETLSYNPFEPINATQIAFVIIAVPFTWGLLKLQVGNVIPIARSLVVDVMKDSVIVLDNQFHIVDLNTAAQILSQHFAPNVIGRKIQLEHSSQSVQQNPYLKIHDVSEHFLTGNLVISLNQTTYEQANRVLEITINNELHHFDMDISPLNNWQQNTIGMVIVLRDITPRIQAESLLQEMNNTLEQRVAERTHALQTANNRLRLLDDFKSRLITNISHELRTPVTNIVLYLDLLSRSDTEKHEKYMKIIHEQSNRLRELVENVVEMSHLEVTKADVLYEPIKLGELVQSKITTKASTIAASGLQLETDITTEVPAIMGNVAQLNFMLDHLMDNAIKYTNEGSIEVSLFLEPSQNFVILEIGDSGVGIAEEDLPHIFDQFYRGKNISQSNIPGMGLGLFVAKEVVDLHQAKISVLSKKGMGTTFQILFPTNISNLESVY